MKKVYLVLLTLLILSSGCKERVPGNGGENPLNEVSELSKPVSVSFLLRAVDGNDVVSPDDLGFSREHEILKSSACILVFDAKTEQLMTWSLATVSPIDHTPDNKISSKYRVSGTLLGLRKSYFEGSDSDYSLIFTVLANPFFEMTYHDLPYDRWVEEGKTYDEVQELFSFTMTNTKHVRLFNNLQTAQGDTINPNELIPVWGSRKVSSAELRRYAKGQDDTPGDPLALGILRSLAKVEVSFSDHAAQMLEDGVCEIDDIRLVNCLPTGYLFPKGGKFVTDSIQKSVLMKPLTTSIEHSNPYILKDEYMHYPENTLEKIALTFSYNPKNKRYYAYVPEQPKQNMDLSNAYIEVVVKVLNSYVSDSQYATITYPIYFAEDASSKDEMVAKAVPITRNAWYQFNIKDIKTTKLDATFGICPKEEYEQEYEFN